MLEPQLLVTGPQPQALTFRLTASTASEVFLDNTRPRLVPVCFLPVCVSMPDLNAGVHTVVFCAHRERKENLARRVTQEWR